MSGFQFNSGGTGTGGGTGTPAKPLFSTGTPLFGATSNPPASSSPAPTLFGSTSQTPATGSTPALFGAAPSASTPSLFGNTGATASPGASLGKTPATTFAFGNNTGSSTPASTPAPNKLSFLPSTTPAGPPPGQNMFGAQQPQTGQLNAGENTPKPTLFGTPASSAGQSQPPASTAGGSSLFGALGNTDANKNNSSTPAPATSGLFGGLPSTGAQAAPATTKPSMFGTLGSTTPASKPPSFSIGGTPTSTDQAPNKPSGTLSSPFTLGGNKPTPASTAAPTTNLFSGATTPGAGPAAGSTGGLSFSKPASTPPAATSATPAAAATTASSGGTATSLFPNFGNKQTTPAAASTGTGTPSLFGTGAAKPAASSAQTAPTTTATASATPAAGAGAGAGATTSTPGLASSTVGPAPSQQSRLKNKSMDEIITRWAADLSKYQKEFQSQAETIARWDRTLVENAEKVKQLYSKTFQAERDASEVEKQLTLMEENQLELDSYLDRYEKEVDNMMKLHGVGGRSDGLRGPDQERERTYKLAEKLQDRLNELNKDLTEMIDEINTTSQTLSKTGKPDDPLTKVVKILNSQLSNLQVIDSGAAQLQEKIEKAQKESQRVSSNGWNGLGSDPADDFYRSMRGGRTERFGGVS